MLYLLILTAQGVSMKLSHPSFTQKMIAMLCLATATQSFSKHDTESFALTNQAVSDCFSQETNREWKYLEYFLVIKPNSETQEKHLKTQVGVVATTAACVLTAKIYLTHISNHRNRDPFDSVAVFCASVIAGSAAYLYNSTTEIQIKRATLIDFLTNWNHHRQYVPAELVPAFDELAVAFRISGSKVLTDDTINQIFTIVVQLVEHAFGDKRYPKEKKSFDVLKSLKTMTDISKTLAGK
jgi:hypothetical protein